MLPFLQIFTNLPLHNDKINRPECLKLDECNIQSIMYLDRLVATSTSVLGKAHEQTSLTELLLKGTCS